MPKNWPMPGHSPQMHPKRDVLGPEPLIDPRNWVPPLEPMFGPEQWVAASEVGPRDACERCGSSVRAHGIFCCGCHRVHPDHQRKLSAERRCDPKPVPRPKPKADAAPTTARERRVAAVAEKRARQTARDQKRLLDAYRRFRGDPDADAWAERVGLKATA